MVIARDKSMEGHVKDIVDAFSDCLLENGSSKTIQVFKSKSKDERKKERQQLKMQMKKARLLSAGLKTNVVNELLSAVISSRV